VVIDDVYRATLHETAKPLKTKYDGEQFPFHHPPFGFSEAKLLGSVCNNPPFPQPVKLEEDGPATLFRRIPL
jgi:hypothetical protein